MLLLSLYLAIFSCCTYNIYIYIAIVSSNILERLLPGVQMELDNSNRKLAHRRRNYISMTESGVNLIARQNEALRLQTCSFRK